MYAKCTYVKAAASGTWSLEWSWRNKTARYSLTMAAFFPMVCVSAHGRIHREDCPLGRWRSFQNGQRIKLMFSLANK